MTIKSGEKSFHMCIANTTYIYIYISIAIYIQWKGIYGKDAYMLSILLTQILHLPSFLIISPHVIYEVETLRHTVTT